MIGGKRLPEGKNPPTGFNRVCGVVRDCRPRIRVMIWEYVYEGLLDSGAEVNVIEYDPTRQRVFERMSPATMGIRSLSGNTLTVKGRVEVELKWEEKWVNMQFLVVERPIEQLIIGFDSWKALGFQIMREQQVMSLEIDNRWNIQTQLSTYHRMGLKKALDNFIVSTPKFLGRTKVLEHQIELTEGAKPFVERPHLFSPAVEQKMAAELDRMISRDVIEPSKSCCASAVVPVSKPDGSVRLCLDSRRLNAITVRDQFPQPNAQRIFARIQKKCKYFSIVDLKEAFWQVPLSERKVNGMFATSRELTAFVVPGKGLYHFKVMPFGLSNSAATQCRLMYVVLGYDLEPRVFVYIDDILILAETVEEMIYLIGIVASRLSKANLSINIEKSKFFVAEVKYLGYILSTDGVKADPEKISCIVNYPPPANITELRRFLGLSGYYRRLVPKYAQIANPLTELTKKNSFRWTKKAQEAFEKLKSVLTTAPVLGNPDFNEQFIVQTDASDLGGAAILSQKIDGKERVIVYFSVKWDEQEIKYSATEKEALAVLKAIENFRGYIYGTQFVVITDAAALTYIKTMKVEGQRRLSRWALTLSEYDMTIKHRAGRLSVAPDALSRVWMASVVEVQKDPWFEGLRAMIQEGEETVRDFKVEGDKVFRYCVGMDEAGIPGFVWKEVVPEAQREPIIKTEHERIKHLGYKKCATNLTKWYWWPGLAEKVKAVLKSCEVCKQIKDPNRKTLVPMGRKPIPSYPFQLISIDHFGPLPRSYKGNSMIFVVIDNFSKFIFLKALRTGQGNGVVEFLRKEVFLKFGVPEIVMSDNARAFVGKQLVSLLNEFGIEHWTNAYCHPQANTVERYMRTIGMACRAQVLKDKGDQRGWDEGLETVQMAMNSVVSEATGKSPFFVIFGHEYMSLGSKYAQLSHETTRLEIDRVELMSFFDKMRQEVADQMKSADRRNREKYDLRARPQKFLVGEKVWVANKKLSDAAEYFCKKLDVKYVAGKVVDTLGNDVYWVEAESGVKRKLHANDLLKD